MNKDFCIKNKKFQSRLILGTGRYRSLLEAKQSIEASGCDIVTVAIRRINADNIGFIKSLIKLINWQKYWLLPNTAGCQTAEEAIRVANLGQEIAKQLGQVDNNFVKLEVIPANKYLFPDPIGTLKAAEHLVKQGFVVLPYINSDPILAKQLEDIGCSAVMPLASAIGSGQGLKNIDNIRIIVEASKVPVIVDAGIGVPSEATQVMEIGADAVLINTAVAQCKVPVAMANAMRLAVAAGYEAHSAGRIPIKNYARTSSPNFDRIGQI
uniref:Thiazole synthase n=2 Tax=Cyanidium caldarium TaxID=2771 RepID=THIG_CYACA|nr:RecName: Full=Thiazole synthase [Cyanidium caldarium]